MCGIAGIINFDHAEDLQDLLCKMIGMMHHRGPDAAGMFMDGPAGLAHARLSIIDLNTGDQPIHNEDRSVWVVFNGEIFNYPELREKLIKRGHRFSTKTDTEVLVHLYEDRGTDMFEDLNGQFAFAIWHKRIGKLLLARDRMGIRPLFYHQEQGRLVFGSEIKALFGDKCIQRSIDLQTLSDIFTCWTPVGYRTPFTDVYQIPPGHFAWFSQRGIEIKKYWQLTFQESSQWDKPLQEWSDELNALLHDATRIRLRADVPVGTYLSGGLDSTYTTAVVKRNFNNSLCTFSVSFSDKRFDEAPFQKNAVEALETEHRYINCSETEIGKLFPDIVWHTEMPILRTAPVPLFMLSKLVRDNHFKVVLTGEGADEIFAGYNIFKEDRVRRFWARHPDSLLRPRLLEKLYPYVFSKGNNKNRSYLTGFFKKGLSEVDSPVYSHLLRWKNTSQIRNFFSKNVQAFTGDIDDFIDRFQATLPQKFNSWHPLLKAQYTEIQLFLPNYLLSSQGDRMAMANSVEGRYPFLDHRVVEFASRVPPNFKLNGLTEKYVLKHAAKKLLPDELIKRPKQPYRAPISNCFFGEKTAEYVEDMLSEEAIKRTGYFNPQKVSRFVGKCRHQKGHLLSERENMALVGILSTQLLHHQFVRNFPAYPGYIPKKMEIYQ